MKFLVFSDDWGEHPSSCQHIFNELTAAHPTIWVNTVGLRLPQFTLSDSLKAVRKLSTMLGLRKPVKKSNTTTTTGKNGHHNNGNGHGNGNGHSNGNGNGHAHVPPHVCAPLMTPFHQPSWVASFNNQSLRRHVLQELKRLDFDEFTIITTTPTVCDVVDKLGAAKIIYYCVDDFSEWPGMEKELILELESRLLTHVDTVICTSQTLYEKFKDEHPTHLLRHGVDLKVFTTPAAQVHECLRHIPAPRVGYFGNFDQRNNQELIIKLAKALPYVSFVFTGPVQDKISALKKLPNVHFTGAVPYKELPAVVKGWEACLLPYSYNALTVNINPLKLKEYLALGKPVIATPLPDVQEFGQYLRVVDERNIGGWRDAIDEAISGQWIPNKQALTTLLANESWQRKADIFLRICQVS